MPRRSKTELQGLVEIIIRMYYQQGKRQQDIADELAQKGYAVSKGGVHRAIKNHSKKLEEIEKSQAWAKTLVAATDKTPRLDIADAGLRIVAMKLLEEMSDIENFGEMDAEKKVVLLTKVSRAIGLAANVELNFDRGRKQGLLDAGKKLEESAGKLGLTDEKMAIIKADFLGLNAK